MDMKPMKIALERMMILEYREPYVLTSSVLYELGRSKTGIRRANAKDHRIARVPVKNNPYDYVRIGKTNWDDYQGYGLEICSVKFADK